MADERPFSSEESSHNRDCTSKMKFPFVRRKKFDEAIRREKERTSRSRKEKEKAKKSAANAAKKATRHRDSAESLRAQVQVLSNQLEDSQAQVQLLSEQLADSHSLRQSL